MHLPAIRPHLTLAYRSNAFPEHIQLPFRSAKNALSACTESVQDQIILPGVKERHDRCLRVRGVDFGENLQPCQASIFQVCVNQANVDISSRKAVENVAL